MKILSSKWLVSILIPWGLLLLCIVPVLAGAVRMTQLASGVVTLENTRFFASPLPVIMHVISVTLFCAISAFQFVPSLRIQNKWHRSSGRMLVPFGFASAMTGLWMAHFYALPTSDGSILYLERLLFGGAMFVSLCLGLMAIRRRDYTHHRNWMMRAYAIGLGAGTQVVTNGPWILLVGTPSVNTRAVLMGAGWVINLVVVEWVIGRSRHSLQLPLAAV
jgi:uncharacterized membrane protein YozB (DUF420 family)